MIHENFDLEAKLLALNWSLTALSGSVILARIYSRLCAQRLSLWWDDWIMVVTWLLLLITSIYSVFQLRGFGVPISDLTAQEKTDFLFWTDLVTTIVIITTSSAKTAFCVTLIKAATPPTPPPSPARNSAIWSQSSAETSRPHGRWRDTLGNWQWGIEWPTGQRKQRNEKNNEMNTENKVQSSKWRDSLGNWRWPNNTKRQDQLSPESDTAVESRSRWRDSVGNWQWGMRLGAERRQIWVRWMSWAILASVNLVSLAAGILIWTHCNPIAKTYRPDVPGQCFSNIATTAIPAANSSFSGAMDLFLSFLPILILRGKGLTGGQKLGAFVCVMIGSLAAAAAFVKAAETQLGLGGDLALTGISILIWDAVEPHVLVIAASLPSLARLIWPPRDDDRTMVSSAQTWRIPTPEGLREAMDRPVTTANLKSPTGNKMIAGDVDRTAAERIYPAVGHTYPIRVVAVDIEHVGESPWSTTSVMARPRPRPRPKSSGAPMRPPPLPVRDVRRVRRSGLMGSGVSANAMFI